MKRHRMSEGDREHRRRMLENVERTRRLAEKGLGALPESARAERERAGSNAEWLRMLAEKAQADVDLGTRKRARL